MFLVKSILSFDEASDFLNLSKSYLYKLTSSRAKVVIEKTRISTGAQ